MRVSQLKSLVSTDLDAVNNLIIDKTQSQIGLITNLAQYVIDSGGKRLRPLLVLLSSLACGYEGKEHITLAAVIEFFHTASLLHDDVVDESTLRRGRETANEIWGTKASILVGDYFFTQSLRLLVDVNNTKILELIASTAHQISCGEVKQLVNRNQLNFSISDYLEVIRDKTASLFAAAASIGAYLTNNDPTRCARLYEYGLHLGNAFQLIDDVMDYCGDVPALGKNIGDDLANGKLTLPLLHALKKGSATQQKLIKESIKMGNLSNLNAILETIQETKSMQFTHDYAALEIEKALTALHSLPESIYKEALKELAQFAIDRDH